MIAFLVFVVPYTYILSLLLNTVKLAWQLKLQDVKLFTPWQLFDLTSSLFTENRNIYHHVMMKRCLVRMLPIFGTLDGFFNVIIKSFVLEFIVESNLNSK